jgi:hypothetical protein
MHSSRSRLAAGDQPGGSFGTGFGRGNLVDPSWRAGADEGYELWRGGAVGLGGVENGGVRRCVGYATEELRDVELQQCIGKLAAREVGLWQTAMSVL